MSFGERTRPGLRIMEPYRGCGVEAKNITVMGFDYFPACSARRPDVRRARLQWCFRSP
jgi:hypothetical protein